MTQKQQVKDHIDKYGKITSMTAFTWYGITRLSARIYELRHDDGLDIANKHVAKKKDGKTIVWDEYYYA